MPFSFLLASILNQLLHILISLTPARLRLFFLGTVLGEFRHRWFHWVQVSIHGSKADLSCCWGSRNRQCCHCSVNAGNILHKHLFKQHSTWKCWEREVCCQENQNSTNDKNKNQTSKNFHYFLACHSWTYLNMLSFPNLWSEILSKSGRILQRYCFVVLQVSTMGKKNPIIFELLVWQNWIIGSFAGFWFWYLQYECLHELLL